LSLTSHLEIIAYEAFSNTAADIIHVFVESIINQIKAGEDYRKLPDKSTKVTLWV
jgi:hypothetical protein